MPSPKTSAEALVALAELADTHIAALRPLLPQIDAAEAVLRRSLIDAGLPLKDHIANRARFAEMARIMVDTDLGKTLAETMTRAFADELKRA